MHYEKAPRFEKVEAGCRKSVGKSAREWHFTLRGKPRMDAKELSPKEATAMSRDIKYIGMDVHTEAIVMAVRNGSGKLVMESIVETNASSILEFIHGLRGELHVTWEKAPGQPGCTIVCPEKG
jgi:hypothetical protein